MKRDEFLQVIRSPFHFATCDAVLRGCKIVDISKPPQWRRMSKKVRSPLDPLCEGTPPAGGGGENCTAARNISGYGKVLSLRPFGAPPSQREVFRHAGGRAVLAPTVFIWQNWCFLTRKSAVRKIPHGTFEINKVNSACGRGQTAVSTWRSI